VGYRKLPTQAAALFQARLRTFGTRLKRPRHCPDSNAQPDGNAANREPLGMKSCHAVAVEDLSRTVRGEILPRPAVDRFSHLPRCVVVSIALLTGEGPFSDQGSFELAAAPNTWGRKRDAGFC
jgi:hypothetical protein